MLRYLPKIVAIPAQRHKWRKPTFDLKTFKIKTSGHKNNVMYLRSFPFISVSYGIMIKINKEFSSSITIKLKFDKKKYLDV